jgi:hypothetical protein
MKEFNPIIFWQWCGFKHEECDVTSGSKCPGGHLISPDGKVFYGEYDCPELTLDNLFKYAMPRFRNWQMKSIFLTDVGGCVIINLQTFNDRRFVGHVLENNLVNGLKNLIWAIICSED